MCSAVSVPRRCVAVDVHAAIGEDATARLLICLPDGSKADRIFSASYALVSVGRSGQPPATPFESTTQAPRLPYGLPSAL
jgi:hypothetical protein